MSETRQITIVVEVEKIAGKRQRNDDVLDALIAEMEGMSLDVDDSVYEVLTAWEYAPKVVKKKVTA